MTDLSIDNDFGEEVSDSILREREEQARLLQEGFGGDDDDDDDENSGTNSGTNHKSEEEEEEDDDIDLDENGNPVIKKVVKAAASANPNDMTEEELAELAMNDASIEKLQPKTVVTMLAAELGIESTAENPLSLKKITSEIKKLRSFDDEKDADLKILKQFKSVNPDATIYDYVAEMVSPAATALLLDDRSLYTEYLVNAKKMSLEEAREEVAAAKEDGSLADKIKPVREKLTERDAAHKEAVQAKIEKDKLARNEEAKANQLALFNSMKSNKVLFDGLFTVTNNDILNGFNFVKEGKLAEAIKDPKTCQEIAYFLTNKDQIVKAIKANSFEEGKGLVIEKMFAAKPNQQTRAVSGKKRANQSSDEF